MMNKEIENLIERHLQIAKENIVNEINLLQTKDLITFKGDRALSIPEIRLLNAINTHDYWRNLTYTRLAELAGWEIKRHTRGTVHYYLKKHGLLTK